MIRDVVAEKSSALGLTIENVVDRECWDMTVFRMGSALNTQDIPDNSYTVDSYAVVYFFTQEEFQRFSARNWRFRKTRPCFSTQWGLSRKGTPFPSTTRSSNSSPVITNFPTPPLWPRSTKFTTWW